MAVWGAAGWGRPAPQMRVFRKICAAGWGRSVAWGRQKRGSSVARVSARAGALGVFVERGVGTWGAFAWRWERSFVSVLGREVGGGEPAFSCETWGLVWATAFKERPRGERRTCLGRWEARVQHVTPSRAAALWPVCRPATSQEKAPKVRGAWTRPGPGRAGPSEGDITVGDAGHASPVFPDSIALARPWPSRIGGREPGRDGPEDLAPGGVAEYGGGEGVAGHEGDIWSLGRGGGRREGAEGKRNII